jgi:hypothetical protein
MELLQAGFDCFVIALWLSHESIETTQTYLRAHPTLKEAALAKLKPYERGKRTGRLTTTCSFSLRRCEQPIYRMEQADARSTVRKCSQTTGCFQNRSTWFGGRHKPPR